MSRLKGRGLEIDDPLGPGPSRQEQEAAVQRGTEHTVGLREDEADGASGRRQRGAGRPRSELRTTAQATNRSSAVRDEPAGRTKHGAETDGRAWREWSGLTGVGSFRLPHELLAELGDTARGLQLPIGMIVRPRSRSCSTSRRTRSSRLSTVPTTPGSKGDGAPARLTTRSDD